MAPTWAVPGLFTLVFYCDQKPPWFIPGTVQLFSCFQLINSFFEPKGLFSALCDFYLKNVILCHLYGFSEVVSHHIVFLDSSQQTIVELLYLFARDEVNVHCCPAN